MTNSPTDRGGRKWRWATLLAAAIAAVASVAAAGGSVMGWAVTKAALSGAVKPGYEALCITYSDFVLTQAHNGYSPEQIQQVIDFAGSHAIAPDHPEQFRMPNRWRSISDANACGTPAQIIDRARR